MFTLYVDYCKIHYLSVKGVMRWWWQAIQVTIKLTTWAARCCACYRIIFSVTHSEQRQANTHEYGKWKTKTNFTAACTHTNYSYSYPGLVVVGAFLCLWVTVRLGTVGGSIWQDNWYASLSSSVNIESNQRSNAKSSWMLYALAAPWNSFI